MDKEDPVQLARTLQSCQRHTALLLSTDILSATQLCLHYLCSSFNSPESDFGLVGVAAWSTLAPFLSTQPSSLSNLASSLSRL